MSSHSLVDKMLHCFGKCPYALADLVNPSYSGVAYTTMSKAYAIWLDCLNEH